MNETAPVLTQEQRSRVRFSRLVCLQAQADLLALQIRQETAALVEQDTPFAHRSFVPDELSMAIAESTGTCGRRVDDARITVAHPRLMALVAASAEAALASGEAIVTHDFGVRHLDACLDELAGTKPEVQDQVLDLVLTDSSVRTPHQHRRAIRAALLALDLEGTQDKQDRIHDRREVTLVDETDGSASLFVGGTKSKAAEMLAAIDAHVAVPAAGDTRTLAQRRYDFVHGLLCGRVQVTAPWQALIVVSLETLEGGDAPAEIPGLGLVSAQEAREVCALADLRRAVVDAHGQLVSLDDTVVSGDLTPLGAAPADVASHEVEPQPVDDEAPAATLEEAAWLAAQEDDAAAESRLLSFCDSGVARLEQMLREHALSARVGAAASAGWTVTRWTPPSPPGEPQPPSGGGGPPRPRPVRPGGDGRGTPAEGPPAHPTWAERDWLAQQEDAMGVHDGSSVSAMPRSVWSASFLAQQLRQERLERQARASRWTTQRLLDAVTRFRTATPSPVPDRSNGYLFRGRLRRWIQIRDVTCTFPGCQRIAQRCEIDHVVAYPFGATSHGNAACECVHHHQAKHASIPASRQADGSMLWTNRFGVTAVRPPTALLRGW